MCKGVLEVADYEYDNIFAKKQNGRHKVMDICFAKSSDLNKIMCKGVLEVAYYEYDNVFAKNKMVDIKRPW